MTLREKMRNAITLRRGDGDGNGGEGSALEQAHLVGSDLLAAGDEAIRRALSGDSESFLRANRQQGGE